MAALNFCKNSFGHLMKMIWCRSLLFFFIIFYHVSPGTPALSKAALQQTKNLMKNVCKRSSGVKQEMLNQLQAGQFPEDNKFKCYIHCVFGMMKTMKKDKITVPEAVKQAEMLLPEDIKEATLKQLYACKDAEGKDACDKAFNFAKCCYGVDPTNMLIPT